MKICVSTSDKYLHLLPVFCYLFNRFWDATQLVTILGYSKPKCELPVNFSFHSMGKQGDVSEWSTDLRRYFSGVKDNHFIWLMEDTLLRREVVDRWTEIETLLTEKVGRFDLTNDIQKRTHYVKGTVVYAHDYTNYRLSTMPSVWNKKFLLEYLTPGLTPWEFEKQLAINDGWHIIGFTTPPVKCNEGVRKSDPHLLDLNGFDVEEVEHINSLL